MHHDNDTGDCGGRCVLELIRARAYQLYETRGHAPDRALDDWLTAERELKQQLGLESLCNERTKPSY